MIESTKRYLSRFSHSFVFSCYESSCFAIVISCMFDVPS
jgi:hypothetical protein